MAEITSLADVVRELALTALYEGVEVDDVRVQTDWDLRMAADVQRTPPPTDAELRALRRLQGAAA